MRWVSLGEYIEPFKQKCGDKNALVSGVNVDKQFISTRANLEDVDVSKYYKVPARHFACNLMHIGRDERIPIAYNDSPKTLVVTSAYYVFKIKEDKRDELLDEYLYIFFKLPEQDRLAWFYTDSSIRGNLPENRFKDIQIPLPDIDEQRKIVSVWKGLRDLKVQNEVIAEPLFELCQSYLKQLKEEYEPTEIGPYIESYDQVNTKGYNHPVVGINKNKEFMPTVANIENIDIKKYKVISKNVFVFSGMQTGRDVCIRIGLYNGDNSALMSPAYTTFKVKDDKKLIPEFLFLCFNNNEMDRYGWFISDSSVRSNLDWNRFLEIKIPIPSPEKQRAIVNIYNCAKEAKDIANKTDQLIKDICPALMRQVIGEAS